MRVRDTLSGGEGRGMGWKHFWSVGIPHSTEPNSSLKHIETQQRCFSPRQALSTTLQVMVLVLVFNHSCIHAFMYSCVHVAHDTQPVFKSGSDPLSFTPPFLKF